MPLPRLSTACRNPIIPGFLTLAMLSLGMAPSSATSQTTEGVQHALRGRIESIRLGLAPRAGGDLLLARVALPLFYEHRSATTSTGVIGRSVPHSTRHRQESDVLTVGWPVLVDTLVYSRWYRAPGR